MCRAEFACLKGDCKKSRGIRSIQGKGYGY
jgi:hypothetical protein